MLLKIIILFIFSFASIYMIYVSNINIADETNSMGVNIIASTLLAISMPAYISLVILHKISKETKKYWRKRKKWINIII